MFRKCLLVLLIVAFASSCRPSPMEQTQDSLDRLKNSFTELQLAIERRIEFDALMYESMATVLENVWTTLLENQDVSVLPLGDYQCWHVDELDGESFELWRCAAAISSCREDICNADHMIWWEFRFDDQDIGTVNLSANP